MDNCSKVCASIQFQVIFINVIEILFDSKDCDLLLMHAIPTRQKNSEKLLSTCKLVESVSLPQPKDVQQLFLIMGIVCSVLND